MAVLSPSVCHSTAQHSQSFSTGCWISRQDSGPLFFVPKSKNMRAWVWRRGHERTQGLYFSGKKSKREGLSMQKRAWADSGPLFLCQKVKTWGPECAKEGMSGLRASILVAKSQNVRAWVWKRGHERTQGLNFVLKSKKRRAWASEKRAWGSLTFQNYSWKSLLIFCTTGSEVLGCLFFKQFLGSTSSIIVWINIIIVMIGICAVILSFCRRRIFIWSNSSCLLWERGERGPASCWAALALLLYSIRALFAWFRLIVNWRGLATQWKAKTNFHFSW